MKIGIDAHNLEQPGKTGPGVARYLEGLITQWAKLGTTTQGTEHEFILYFKDLIPENLPTAKHFKPVLVNRIGPSSTALFYNAWLPKAAHADKVDLLFLPLYMQPFSYMGKTAVTVHDISYRVHPEWFPKLKYQVPLRMLTYWAVKKANLILTVSEYSKSEIARFYPGSERKIEAIHLGADERFKVIKDQEALDDVKKRYGINNKFIFYIGTIFNRRSIPETIKAFARIADSLPEYQFLVSGRDHTNPAQHIDQIIDTVNDIADRKLVIRYDYLPEKDLVPLFNAADLYVWLSTYEGFGLSPVEAMACGTPVLSTNMTALKETVGDSGFVVDNPSDIDALADTLKTALTDDSQRAAFIERGFRQAASFNWERAAAKTLESFERYAK